MKAPTIFATLPVLNESANLPALMDCLKKQQLKNFVLVACVNNYDHWWKDSEFESQCQDNQRSIEYLKEIEGLEVIVIDRSSKESGWTKKKGGVGWARKIAMDHAAEIGAGGDLIVTIDADTHYPENFFEEVNKKMLLNPVLTGLAIPYYHKLAGDDTDRLILRYEIYMRHYLLNMLLIQNPYAFTAIGSAMATTVKSYNRVGGITPVKSGEDFYFIQKLAKNGDIGNWCDTLAYPSPRFSSRVIFGTGPALIKGSSGNWDSYPLHPAASFERVRRTFDSFPSLYQKDIPTPMDRFLKAQFKVDNIWGPLRKNYKDLPNFVNACTRKVDGLRILQFLRNSRKEDVKSDEQVLQDFILDHIYSDGEALYHNNIKEVDFQTSSIEHLDEIRNHLFKLENTLRRKRDELLTQE